MRELLVLAIRSSATTMALTNIQVLEESWIRKEVVLRVSYIDRCMAVLFAMASYIEADFLSNSSGCSLFNFTSCSLLNMMSISPFRNPSIARWATISGDCNLPVLAVLDFTFPASGLLAHVHLKTF